MSSHSFVLCFTIKSDKNVQDVHIHELHSNFYLLFISLKYLEFALFMLIAEVIVFFIVQFVNFYTKVYEYTLAFLGPALVYCKKLPAKIDLGEFCFAFCLKKALQNIIAPIILENKKYLLVSVTSAWGQTYKYRIWVVQTPGAASLCDLNYYFLLSSHFCNVRLYSAQKNLKTW